MRDIDACFCYAQNGYDDKITTMKKERLNRKKTIGSTVCSHIKTVPVYIGDMSSLVVHELYCFFHTCISIGAIS